MENKQIKVYTFGELEPGTELVLKSAYDELKAENEEWKSQAYLDAERADTLAKQNEIYKAALQKIEREGLNYEQLTQEYLWSLQAKQALADAEKSESIKPSKE